MAEAQDAVALLKADHRAVEELFAKFENASGDGAKQKIALTICKELSVHAQIEEEIFYPACEGKVEEDLLKEAYVEHDGAKVLIAEIEAGGPSDEYYDAKVTVLKEQIEHHVEEEEKRLEGLFSQARDLFVLAFAAWVALSVFLAGLLEIGLHDRLGIFGQLLRRVFDDPC